MENPFVLFKLIELGFPGAILGILLVDKKYTDLLKDGLSPAFFSYWNSHPAIIFVNATKPKILSGFLELQKMGKRRHNFSNPISAMDSGLHRSTIVTSQVFEFMVNTSINGWIVISAQFVQGIICVFFVCFYMCFYFYGLLGLFDLIFVWIYGDHCGWSRVWSISRNACLSYYCLVMLLCCVILYEFYVVSDMLPKGEVILIWKVLPI